MPSAPYGRVFTARVSATKLAFSMSSSKTTVAPAALRPFDRLHEQRARLRLQRRSTAAAARRRLREHERRDAEPFAVERARS